MKTAFVDCIASPREDAIALIDDTEQLTYGQLRHSACQIATLLRAKYGKRQYIVIRATPNASFVRTMLGIMFSGNTVIPTNPDLPQTAIDYIKDKSRAAGVINPIEPSEFRGKKPTQSQDKSIPPFILFTSGTTGFPKGVIISNDNLLYSCTVISNYLSYAKYRSAAIVLPLFYSYALLSQVCCQLFVGGTIRLFSDFRNPFKFNQIVNETKLETFCGVPATYNALSFTHRANPLHMPTVRVLCSAGAAMDRSIFKEIKEIFPNSVFFNNYGMTEAAPRLTYIREDDTLFFEPTCGRPIDGVQIKIVDPETHTKLRDGERGMLVVRGPNITSGYLNDKMLTKKSFTKEGYLISGDIAYKDNRYIFICGRYDDMFHVGGEKVAPLEIERVLNENPAVEMSAVAPMPNKYRGNVPAAFLKLKNLISRKELVYQLQQKLPMSKIPQYFFEVRTFPVTSNGKLQRKKLTVEGSDYIIREIT